MDAPVAEGEVLAGKYRVERVLGVGGMGVVVAARHIHLGERVAIKFLLEDAMRVPQAVERFLREARAAVRIKSEHVVKVTDVGQLDSGAPYMVMEFLEGLDLSDVIRQQGPLPFEDAVDYLLQACVAIADAHAMGVVHRDLKPANLMLVRRSDGTACVKVLDFGISKSTDPASEGHAMTRTSAVMGSPSYMSPEQMVSARDVDQRTDIWALGAILQELVTARPPFEAETLTALVLAIDSKEPTPVRSLRPDAPEPIVATIAGCLRKRRDERFATVANLAASLAPVAPSRSRALIERAAKILEGAGMLTTGSLTLPPSVRPPAGGTQASWGQTADEPGQRPARGSRAGLVVGLGLGALVLVGGGLALVISFSGSTEPAAASAGAQPARADLAAETTSPQPPAPVVSAASAVPAGETQPLTPDSLPTADPAGVRSPRAPGPRRGTPATEEKPPVAGPPPPAAPPPAAAPPAPPAPPPTVKKPSAYDDL